jgi:hypothetical protein
MTMHTETMHIDIVVSRSLIGCVVSLDAHEMHRLHNDASKQADVPHIIGCT